jgi:hypothetical protein
MDKQKLRTKLEEIQNNIKANSKDADYAETLLNELLSTHGQLKHEPTLVHIPLSSIEKKCEGDTFTMSITKDGKAVYHTRGGYTVIADATYTSLFDTIYHLIDYINGAVKLDDELKVIMDGDVVATSYVLNIPLYAMGDYEFKVDLFNKTYEYLTKAILDAESELQDETYKENIEFKEAVEALQNLKNE